MTVSETLAANSVRTDAALADMLASVGSDPGWAIRMLGEYAHHAGLGDWSLASVDPGLPRLWNTAVAAVTCWAAERTNQECPAWARECPPVNPPWAPVEALGIRPWLNEPIPSVIAAKGILLRERDLWKPHVN